MFVCYCHLNHNPRMTSSYLVNVKTKKEAKDVMKDGEHIVDAVITFSEYVTDYGWPTISADNEGLVMSGKPVCLEAGT